MNTDSQWSKQEACFVPVPRVWLSVNYTQVSLLSNEFDVGASEFGSCQSNLCHS